MTDFDTYKEQASLQKKQRLFYVAAAAIFLVGIAVFFARPIFSQSALNKDKGPQLIPGQWLAQYFGTSDPDALTVGGYFGDPDQDGLNNYQEYIYGTNPLSADTDLDGYPDGNEVAYGRNPNQSLTEVAGLQAEQELTQAGVEIPREEIKQHIENELETTRKPYVREWNKSQLQIIDDHSESTMGKYAKDTEQALAHLSSATSEEVLSANFEGVAIWQIDNFIRRQQTTMDQLQKAIVPEQLSDYHLVLMKVNEGFLAMAIAAKEWIPDSGLALNGWLFPEVQYIAEHEKVFVELGTSVSEKFNISL